MAPECDNADFTSRRDFIVHGVPELREVPNKSYMYAYAYVYVQGDIDSDVKGSVCFASEFALPPFSLPHPCVVQFSKHNSR